MGTMTRLDSPLDFIVLIRSARKRFGETSPKLEGRRPGEGGRFIAFFALSRPLVGRLEF
jgi:hypothetical protein